MVRGQWAYAVHPSDYGRRRTAPRVRASRCRHRLSSDVRVTHRFLRQWQARFVCGCLSASLAPLSFFRTSWASSNCRCFDCVRASRVHLCRLVLADDGLDHLDRHCDSAVVEQCYNCLLAGLAAEPPGDGCCAIRRCLSMSYSGTRSLPSGAARQGHDRVIACSLKWDS